MNRITNIEKNTKEKQKLNENARKTLWNETEIWMVIVDEWFIPKKFSIAH